MTLNETTKSLYTKCDDESLTKWPYGTLRFERELLRALPCPSGVLCLLGNTQTRPDVDDHNDQFSQHAQDEVEPPATGRAVEFIEERIAWLTEHGLAVHEGLVSGRKTWSDQVDDTESKERQSASHAEQQL